MDHANASDVFHRKRLHGGFVEEISELYDFKNRWLDPEEGSWLSRDKLGQLDSENMYQAFLSAPLMMSDPFGSEVTPTCVPCGMCDFFAQRASADLCSGLENVNTESWDPVVKKYWEYMSLMVCKVPVKCLERPNGECAKPGDIGYFFGNPTDGFTIYICFERKRGTISVGSFDIGYCFDCIGDSFRNIILHESQHIACFAGYKFSDEGKKKCKAENDGLHNNKFDKCNEAIEDCIRSGNSDCEKYIREDGIDDHAYPNS